MICPYCGNQTADNSTFCIHCGSSFAQPQYQYQTPVSNDAVNENYENAKYYIEIADAILSPAIKAFIYTNIVFFVIIGQFYAIAKRSFVKKWVKKLPDVDESLLDPVTYEEYKTARGKVTAAKRFSKIAYILSVLTLVLLGILVLELIVLGIIVAVGL